MLLSSVQTFVRNARDQVAQRDINDSIVKAFAELIRENKRLHKEIRRAQRKVQVSRRF